MLSKSNSGFSLIEILIVLGILGLVVLIAVPSISNTFRFSVKSSAQDIAGLIKEASNAAQITGKTYRLAFDLKSDEYWVESTSEDIVIEDASAREKKKEKRGLFDTEKESESPFKQDKILSKKKKSLGLSVRFKDVITEQTDQPITEGIAYTHVFAHGLVERTLVHLIDSSSNEVTLIVSALNGRSGAEGRYVPLKEAFP